MIKLTEEIEDEEGAEDAEDAEVIAAVVNCVVSITLDVGGLAPAPLTG